MESLTIDNSLNEVVNEGTIEGNSDLPPKEVVTDLPPKEVVTDVPSITSLRLIDQAAKDEPLVIKDGDTVNPNLFSNIDLRVEAVTNKLVSSARFEINGVINNENSPPFRSHENFKLDENSEYKVSVQGFSDPNQGGIASKKLSITFRTGPYAKKPPVVDPPPPVKPPAMEAPKGWPSKSPAYNENLPMAGIFYGNPKHGVFGAGNGDLTNHHAMRFRAPKTGTIANVSWQNRRVNNEQTKARCNAYKGGKRPSYGGYCTCIKVGLKNDYCGYIIGKVYSAGSGGNYRTHIHPDNGKGLPNTSVSLGNTGKNLFNPASHGLNKFVKQTVNAKVTAGHWYYIGLENTTPVTGGKVTNLSTAAALKKQSSSPNEGAISLNGTYFGNRDHPGRNQGPYFGANGMEQFHTNRNYGSGWFKDNNSFGWMRIEYTDGTIIGDTSAAYDVAKFNESYEGTQYIGGSRVGRQVFTVQDASRQVNGIWVAQGYKHKNHGTSPLKVQVKNSKGDVLATASIPYDSGMAKFVDSSSKIFWKTQKRFRYADLSKVVMLNLGQKYSVEFSAPNGANIALMAAPPYTQGVSPEDQRANQYNWPNAKAEISTNGGKTWRNWRIGGGQLGPIAPDRDVSMLFTIVGMPKELSGAK